MSNRYSDTNTNAVSKKDEREITKLVDDKEKKEDLAQKEKDATAAELKKLEEERRTKIAQLEREKREAVAKIDAEQAKVIADETKKRKAAEEKDREDKKGPAVAFTEVRAKGSNSEQVVTEDRFSANTEGEGNREEKITKIKEKIAFNKTADKANMKEVTLAEENLVYGHVSN